MNFEWIELIALVLVMVAFGLLYVAARKRKPPQITAPVAVENSPKSETAPVKKSGIKPRWVKEALNLLFHPNRKTRRKTRAK